MLFVKNPTSGIANKRTLTADGSVTTNDNVILIDCRDGADVTAYLPLLSNIEDGRMFTFSRLEEDTADYIGRISPSGSDTFASGDLEFDLVVYGETLNIMKDGSVYRKVGM